MTSRQEEYLTLLCDPDTQQLWGELLGGFAAGRFDGEILTPGGSFGGGRLQWPLPVAGSITSPFGYRTDPLTGEVSYHTGTDIAASNGTPILAAADGTVVTANGVDNWGGSYGYYVKLDHGNGLQTLYAHCSSMSYAEAKAKYLLLGVDTDAAIAKLKTIPVSLHCWQGDDVRGFDTDPTKPLTGGIQTTGNYPGRARTPEELMSDIDQVLKLCPGTKKMNLHASYAIFEDGEWADRDKLEPKHFAKWVDFCRERGLGCDFNPTFFSHPKANGLTLSSPDPEIRKFWIEHRRKNYTMSREAPHSLVGRFLYLTRI